MDIVMPLIGVLIGGSLVLIGDSVRRRVEWSHEQVQRLLTAGADILAMYNRMLGDLLEAREQGRALPALHAGSGARREASARFFALPGSEALRPQFNALTMAHAQLRRAFAEHNLGQWQDMLAEYEAALLAFLVELRRIVRRGRVPHDPATSLPAVMEVSSPVWTELPGLR
jgi:hypothetical protein